MNWQPPCELLWGRVLGPAAPLIARVQNQYIRQILFKFETAASVKAARTTMLDILSKLNAQPEFKSVRISCDVDPY